MHFFAVTAYRTLEMSTKIDLIFLVLRFWNNIPLKSNERQTTRIIQVGLRRQWIWLGWRWQDQGADRGGHPIPPSQGETIEFRWHPRSASGFCSFPFYRSRLALHFLSFDDEKSITLALYVSLISTCFYRYLLSLHFPYIFLPCTMIPSISDYSQWSLLFLILPHPIPDRTLLITQCVSCSLGEVMEQMVGETSLNIWDIHVDDGYQRKGLGKHLLTLMELIARRYWHSSIAISTLFFALECSVSAWQSDICPWSPTTLSTLSCS